jgi:hypothetical protein
MSSSGSLLRTTTGIAAVADVEPSSWRISPPVASGRRLSSRMRPGCLSMAAWTPSRPFIATCSSI